MNKFKNNNTRNFEIVYVKFHDTINNVFRYLMHQHSQHPLLFETFDELFSMTECRDALIFDETITLDELHDFMENQYAQKYCCCNQEKCKTTFYIMCNSSFETQNIKSMKNVSRVLVETSSNEFVDYMIDDYFDFIKIAA